jgi:2-hydroxychromene-2-carboxylate isomerase
MAKVVDYFLTPVSPFAYLGHSRFRDICARHDAKIQMRVMDLGKVFPVSGGVALKDRAAQRKAYRLMELRRWREYLGIELTLEPKFFPTAAEPAATLILAVLQRHGTEMALDVTGDCLRALWTEDRDISDRATLGEIVGARNLDVRTVMEDAASAETAARYIVHSQEAIARGIFGAPTYVYRDELFWGQDRLDFLDRALAKG